MFWKYLFDVYHNSDVTWYMKLLKTRLYVQQLVQANNKENIKIQHF